VFADSNKIVLKYFCISGTVASQHLTGEKQPADNPAPGGPNIMSSESYKGIDTVTVIRARNGEVIYSIDVNLEEV
jgi:hypothetical protein